MKLTKKARQAITEEIKMRMALSLGKSLYTVARWIKTDSNQLTTIKSIEVLTELTGLKENELFEKE